MPRERLDNLLVHRGLASSRTIAQRLILAGAVRVNDQPARSAAARVPSDARLLVLAGARPPYVSRGGEKLAAALAAFGLDVTGRVALDIGASTGGFTDCLLQHGAARVVAVDVGRGHLAWRLRTDPRVQLLEGTNARYLTPEQAGDRVHLATVDVSFISVLKVLPAVASCIVPGGEIVVLVKPQYEAGRGQAPKGVVRDPHVHAAALAMVRAGARALGLDVLATVESPLRGAKGNREFFLHLRTPRIVSPR